jgi:hypothetical protein
VRHYLLAVFACLSVLLTAATPAFTIVPTVIVYPMTTSNSLNREDAARIMTTLATQIAAGGQIKVIPPSIGIERENYLANARSVGANFYVTGFITPLGQGASIVEQVVSTTSGTLVFSVTNYITSLAEIAAQGDQLRAGIIERSSRGIQAFTAPAPQQANTPAPEASNGTDVNINKLFGRKNAPAATLALAPPANSTLAILTVGGSADADQRIAAARALAGAFEHAGRHAVLVDASVPSNAICAANKATVQVAAWIDPPPANAANANASLRMIAYDCSGKVAFDRTFKQPVSGLTDAAVGAYLNPPKRRA